MGKLGNLGEAPAPDEFPESPLNTEAGGAERLSCVASHVVTARWIEGYTTAPRKPQLAGTRDSRTQGHNHWDTVRRVGAGTALVWPLHTIPIRASATEPAAAEAEASRYSAG